MRDTTRDTTERRTARTARRAGRALALFTPLWLIASACGSDSGGDDASGKCQQGDTRACLGPGQCNGAQSCNADGTWSACDCGGSGGAGGGGGSGGGSGTGGAAGGDGSAGTGGSAGDASADGAGGGTQWKDDPCPTKKPIIDCSTGCGGPSASCAQAMCTNTFYSADPKPAYPYVIRTPSKPGTDPACVKQCGNGSTVYGIGLSWNLPVGGYVGMKVTVPKPWFAKIDYLNDPNHYCLTGKESQCAVYGAVSKNVYVLTNDPNAPAVNALVEEVPWPATCP